VLDKDGASRKHQFNLVLNHPFEKEEKKEATLALGKFCAVLFKICSSIVKWKLWDC